MSKTTLITGSASEYVLDELDNQGLAQDREVDLPRPSIPEDITALEDEELMLLYTQFAAYSDFVNTQLACAIIDEKEAERDRDYAESVSLLKHQNTASSKTTVTVIKALVDGDPELKGIRQAYSNKYAYRKMLETMANNCERGTAVCSRELTRRTAGDNFKTRTRKFTI